MCGLENSRTTSEQRQRQRIFTLADANRSLPLVRRIVSDIVTQYEALSQVLATHQKQVDAGGAAPVHELEDHARAGIHRLNDMVEELHAIGCELKDWETGLVDFRALRGGEPVYLCWRLGEETISHWHELHAGVTGRQPIDDLIQPSGAAAPAIHPEAKPAPA
jgi:hypothetical protein